MTNTICWFVEDGVEAGSDEYTYINIIYTFSVYMSF